MFPLLYVMVLTFWHLNPWAKLKSVTIQMKPSDQCFSVVLFIMLHEIILTFETVGKKTKTQQEKKKKQMNNLKSYRLSGACSFSRRVYSLRSKRQFRAVFKN